MKKIVYLLIVFCLIACSTDDPNVDPDDKEKPIPEIPEEPEKPAELCSLNLSIHSSRTFYPEDIVDYLRPCNIEIFESTDKQIEKRNSDDFGFAYDKKTNTTVTAIEKKSGESLFSTRLEVGKQYYIHVTTLPYEGYEFYDEGGAKSDTIITITSKSSISLKKVFTLRAEPDQYEKWYLRNEDLPEPQFGIAIFGDSYHYIKRTESRRLISDRNNKLTYDWGRWLSYYFDENNKFIKGVEDLSSGYGIQNNMGIPILVFRSQIEECIEKYGAPTYVSQNVFSFIDDDFTSEEGYTMWEARLVIAGLKTFVYKFSNSEMNVEMTLKSYQRGIPSSYYYSYTIETVFTPN